MNNLRRESMREYIEQHHIVTIAQLAERFPEVSQMTIHRDLNALQEHGLVEKIRGGARYCTPSGGEAAFAAREIVARGAKNTIALKAVELLSHSGSVFLDAGTTMMAFAGKIPDHRLNITTTGPNIALELAKRRSPVVNLCGGTLNKSNLTLSGTPAEETVRAINIDIAFLAPSGYSAGAGFTCGMESEARIKQLVIAKARTVVMLMDTSKLERLLPYTFAQLADLDYLVTECQPGQLSQDLLRQAGRTVIL